MTLTVLLALSTGHCHYLTEIFTLFPLFFNSICSTVIFLFFYHRTGLTSFLLVLVSSSTYFTLALADAEVAEQLQQPSSAEAARPKRQSLQHNPHYQYVSFDLPNNTNPFVSADFVPLKLNLTFLMVFTSNSPHHRRR